MSNEKPTFEAARSLATQEGFARFVAIFNAQEAWRYMTKVQRAAVASRLHTPVTTGTMRALERRGLVRDGLLTEWGDWVRAVNLPDEQSGDQSS